MQTRKILSLLLSVVMFFGVFGLTVFADEPQNSTISAYITVSKYGELVNDKDGNAIAQLPIELSGKTAYTLNDLFAAMHDLCYSGGAEAGYASANDPTYGLYVTKFWGDESLNFGYQVNRGTETVNGLSHSVTDGDYVDFCIYQNGFSDLESYTRFDKLTEKIYVGGSVGLTLEQAGYDEDWNMVYSACEGATITVNGTATEHVTGADGKAELSFDTAGKYIISATKTETVDRQTVTAITAPICVVTVEKLPDTVITVPSDVELYVGYKGKTHFIPFTEMKPSLKLENGDTTSYYFDLTTKTTYNYRVSSDKYATYAGTFVKTNDFKLDITEEMLNADGKTKATIDRDTASNSKQNVADIYININPQGHLKLAKGDTYRIVNLRNWEAINNSGTNYFIEPDYHYAVIDENSQPSEVVSIDESGVITAKNEGVAIVLVTYDAMNVNFGSGASFYGAIWPENTGVFVVSVGDEPNDADGIKTGMTINEGKNPVTAKLSGDALDAELDVIYYIGESGSYTFTPETQGLTVSVAQPTVGTAVTYNGFESVSKNADGSFSVPLKTGRNIVKLEKDGKAEYQIITAKAVNITINNSQPVEAGNEISIVFDKLYHPANKLAGVYNMNAVAMYTNVSANEGKIIGGLSAQYNFANSDAAQNVANILKEKNFWGSITYQKESALSVPTDYPYDTFTLSGGAFYVSGFGDMYGNHRLVDYIVGKDPNTKAATRLAFLGKLPDIEIPIVATDAELASITPDLTNVKTDCYAGDAFDTTGLIVTANYADGATQIATNYTVEPKILSTDTKKITISYRGKTAEIEVNVTAPQVTAIEVTSKPVKTNYKAGSTFDPTGMIVTAIYENGVKKPTTDYSYSPNRVLEESDKEIVITYIGSDKADDLSAIRLPISVTSSSSGVVKSTITVYFTLYGDTKHGTPASSAQTHTMSAKNLETWIERTAVTLDKGSYAIDAVATALGIAGIPYQNENNYISSIKGLAELDNGELSGWMYTLNGKYPSLGVNEQELKNGDALVFHYTDDYTVEKTSFSGSSSIVISDTTTYTVKFDTNGGTAVKAQAVERNSFAAVPTTPTKEGYTFEGWFTDKALKKEYDFASKVTKSFTLYAKWTEIVEQEPAAPSFTSETFSDVAEDDWFYEAVKYVFENELMQGTGEGFEPNVNLTRGMLVTILYRLEDADEQYTDSLFEDVSDSAWYAEAIAWASANGIVNGMSETLFMPDDDITREQMALIFYRYAKYKGYDTEITADLAQFEDKDDVEDWALDAMKWANATKLINGLSETLLSPKSSATRAQAATILMRFCESIAKSAF